MLMILVVIAVVLSSDGDGSCATLLHMTIAKELV